jgi:hypothetical protein
MRTRLSSEKPRHSRLRERAEAHRRFMEPVLAALYREGMSNRELARKLTELRIPTPRLLSPGPKTTNGLTKLLRTKSGRRARSATISGEWSPTQVARLLQQVGPRRTDKWAWEANQKGLFHHLLWQFEDDPEKLQAFRSEIDQDGEPVIPAHLWDDPGSLWFLPRKTRFALFGPRC